jgi:methylated-DNA-[protein]-cysteine S-methyltransferase
MSINHLAQFLIKMNNINIQYYKTKIGEMIIGSTNNKLCLLDFRYRKIRRRIDDRIKKGLMSDYLEKDDDLFSQQIILI